MEKGKNPGKSGTPNKSNKTQMDLPEIIRENALCFLPAKSLYRFTTVCRDWKLQISTPFFEHNQSYSFRSLSGLFCQPPGGPPSFISLDPTAYGVPDPELKFLPEPVDIMASSNGLLCSRGRTEDKAYYICNPVKGQWKRLPKPDANHGSDPSLVLAFEPSRLSFVADYKLISAFPSADFDDAYEFEVYSSSEDSWRTSSEIWFGDGVRVLEKGGVYANGVAYWPSGHYHVIAFDLKKNRLNVIPCHELPGLFVLGVADGTLCAACESETEDVNLGIAVKVLSNVFANTMQMTSEGKIWRTKHNLLGLLNISSLNLNEDDQIVLAAGGNAVVFHCGGEILSHDLRTKETTMLSTEAKYSSGSTYLPYVNSLVCLM